jgi:hypothetical protein
MDKRVQTLIDAALWAHTPAWYWKADVADPAQPWCCGCEGTVLHKDCPVVAAAKELEDDDQSS